MTKEERTAGLQYLIRCLEKEMPGYAACPMPEEPQEQFDLYRALCNIRMPHGATGHTLPQRFYEVQSEVLRDLTAEKGITDAMDEQAVPPSRRDPRLAVWQGDITTLRADAIVNAANSQMMGCFQPLHGCIDNMIHTMAGTELREKCYQIMRAQGTEEPTGRAKITPGYNLPAKYVIHTVGPVVTGMLSREEEELLASSYHSILDLAEAYRLRSVAFCCISTGVFRFPPKAAANIAVQTVRAWMDAHPDSSLQKIVFNVFKDSDRKIYEAILS